MRSFSRARMLTLLTLAILLFAGCSEEPDHSLLGPPVSMEQGKTIPAGYYDTVNPSTPAALRTTLHEAIDDHTKIPYTSTATDTWNVLEAADQDPNDTGRVLDIYLNASYVKYGAGNTDYNREHSWPKSFGFPNDGSTNYPYTDCHHLFIANDSYNSSRNNKPYGTAGGSGNEYTTLAYNGVGGGSGVYPGWSNWANTTYWETWTDRRGDVARALMYLDVRYEGGTHGTTGVSEPDLILTDTLALIEASNTGANISTAYMGLLSVLVQWHIQDPVDDKERARNDAVYAFQGNRNPFIDHPEWADCLFAGTCGGGDTTPPAAPTGLTAAAGNGSVGLDWTDNGESDLALYTVYRSTTPGGGYTSLGNVTVSAFNDNGAANGTTYYYVVTASDASANESAQSAEASATPQGGGGGGPATVWINEFHYDNSGTDTGEFVEVAGTAGVDLTGWTVVGYNGSGGAAYKTVNLGGTIADQQGGFGTLSFAFTSMQNGAPDGLALVDDTGALVEFLSYEGAFTGSGGAADGIASTDIGVAETTSTTVGFSLQLAGTGSASGDFTWQAPQNDSPGLPNTGQTFSGGAPVNQAPTAAANGPYSGDTGVAVTFSSAGSFDSDGSIVSYAWTFGDGGTSSAADPSHTYTAAGSYTVTLTVTDDGGLTDVATTSADITDIPPPADAVVWINEFHYDNDGADVDEFVEIVGATGTDLTGWSLVGYNGSGGASYMTVNLSGTLPATMGGFGTATFAMTGLQNGSPDGIALVDGTGAVVQFLSYEGSFTAADGPAAGVTSVDVGVSEASTATVGHTLQLAGTGSSYADFTWQASAAGTQGAVNTGQTLGDGSTGGGGGGWTVITFDDFEAGWGSFVDGGGDCSRYTGGTYAHQGSAAADIQDNSGAASSFTHGSGHDVSGYTDLEVEFWFTAVSMENNEDFWVQYWDGSAWRTIATFAAGTGFNNNTAYHEIVNIPAGTYAYPADAKLRFRCDASNNGDDVYIDEVEFRGFN